LTKLNTLIGASALVLTSLSTQASVISVLDETYWDSVIDPALENYESFESDSSGVALTASVSDIKGVYDFGKVKVESTHFDVLSNSRYVSDGTYAVRGAPGGWYDSKYDAAYGPLSFTFDESINFLSLDVLDLGSSVGTSVLSFSLDGGESHDLLSQGVAGVSGGGNNNFQGSSLFAGVWSSSAFTTISFSFNALLSGNTDDFVSFDNFAFGTTTATIPEPGSLGMLLLGLVGLSLTRRARS
jgi:hypothetical protein